MNGVRSEALRMLAALTLANRLTDKREALAEASGRLDALRITLRLAKRLGYLSNRRRSRADARRVAEVRARSRPQRGAGGGRGARWRRSRGVPACRHPAAPPPPRSTSAPCSALGARPRSYFSHPPSIRPTSSAVGEIAEALRQPQGDPQRVEPSRCFGEGLPLVGEPVRERERRQHAQRL